MCEVCGDMQHVAFPNQRRRIWELSGGWHCAVIGTCLTLADLRTLARKLSVKTRRGYSADYQLHGFFVQEAVKSEKPAKLLNKLLDKRHAVAIRKVRPLNSETELEAFWDAARETGEIPGPYWAILSHPGATQALSERMFADVHMLSHLVGASNRADIRRLQVMEEQTAQLEAKLSKQQRLHRQRLGGKDQQIAGLREKLRDSAKSAKNSSSAIKSVDAACGCASLPALHDELTRLEAETSISASTVQRQQTQIDELAGLVQVLGQENATLEQALVHENLPRKETCPFDLGGRCLLYVGGRQQTVHRLRALVEEWNGQFLHHDGGIERSLGELASAVVKADAVVFPVDCVSHNAANKVKRLCDQSMKPYVPLRTSGVASFVAGLRDNLDTVPANETN